MKYIPPLHRGGYEIVYFGCRLFFPSPIYILPSSPFQRSSAQSQLITTSIFHHLNKEQHDEQRPPFQPLCHYICYTCQQPALNPTARPNFTVPVSSVGDETNILVTVFESIQRAGFVHPNNERTTTSSPATASNAHTGAINNNNGSLATSKNVHQLSLPPLL
eukprot:TCONS_00028569-protein